MIIEKENSKINL